VTIYPHQAERLTQAIERDALGALVATSPENVAYLTGFRRVYDLMPPDPVLGVFTRGGVALIVPAAELSAVVADGVGVDHVVCYGRFHGLLRESASPEVRRLKAIVAGGSERPGDALASTLASLGVESGAVGIDESGLDSMVWQGLVERLAGCKVNHAARSLAEARRVKGPYEIDCLANALRIAEESLDAVIQVLDRGMTEREAALLYAGEVTKRGAGAHCALVTTGANTWIQAGRPTDRALRSGELVRLSVGCSYKGYWGSVTRTAVLGEPAPAVEASYAALLAAVEAAGVSARPGAPARSVFEAAVQSAQKAGLPDWQPPHVGHGIGLRSGEQPLLDAVSSAVLEAGEVLRVEATHYEVGSLGLAVGDTLLVTSTDSRVLNRSRHDLIVLD
jgi:Xaa-Pro aminopeptidase